MRKLTIAALGLGLSLNCTARTGDPHSYADPGRFLVKHVDLAVQVDFESRTLDGVVDLKIRRVDPAARRLVLDSRDLVVRGVSLVRVGSQDEQLEYRFGDSHPILGAPLEILLPQSLDLYTEEEMILLRISYRTQPEAPGLQWLRPEQTAGKKHPFLYTQSKPMHARSWIPLQDTPAVRVTYRATIFPPEGLTAVMSAARFESAGREDEFEFEFAMSRPIPSYLIALAVGDLKFRSLGPRTGVFAEPSVLQAAAYEFAETEAMLKACEKLFGPYYWDRFDLLILPPSFPFGDMENPRLSFIAPTAIAGDRSLVSLIAHQLAHSWSGNMVTHATWGDLWLNEGFTRYLESRIMGALYGERRRAMEDVLDLESLRAELENLPPGDQMLAVDLRGRHPNEAFTAVPYEKGRLFMAYLESRVGRERFRIFLSHYVAQFAFQSIDTGQFLDYLREKLPAVSDAAVRRWVYEPGLPRDALLPRSDLLRKVDAERSAWLENRKSVAALPSARWSTHEWLHFLDNLPKTMSEQQLAALDGTLRLTDAGNAKIAHSWLKIAIRNHYEPALPRLERYLRSIGRGELIKPLYEELMNSQWGAEFARRVYAEARDGYHPIAVDDLDPIVLPVKPP